MNTRKSLRLFAHLALSILLLCVPVALTSCASAPSSRVQEVKTLQSVGVAVRGTMTLAAQLYHDGKIDRALWEKIARMHDDQFLPAYRLAVQAVRSDLSSLASPDLLSLAAQLAALLAPYVAPKS